MKELPALLEGALLATTFRTDGGTVYSVDELRETHAGYSSRVPKTPEVLAAHPVVDDDQLGTIVNYLRDRLGAYLDVARGRIGHCFGVVGDSQPYVTFTPDSVVETQATSSLSDFARGLIRAATVLGPDRAAMLLSKWADGGPRRFKIVVVLAGVWVDEDIVLDEGLRVYRLPVSSDLLPTSLPNMTQETMGQILGHAALEIGASTRPALFVPQEGKVPLHSHTALDQASLDSFFLALSLVCNQQVGLAWSWNDHGESGTFTETGRNSIMSGPGMELSTHGKTKTYHPSTGVVELSSFDSPPPNLCETSLRRAWELRTELQRRNDSDQRFKIAVTRWAKAATPGVLSPDRLIDLRIALEALYLDSREGELGFRLSITGARHLATDLHERKAVRKALADFYGLASRVIHGVPLKRKADVSLVDGAATLCRDGILKIVEQRNQPDWTEFLLS